MPSLSDVYAKFGEVAEAAQLLETQIGNALISTAVAEQDLANQKGVARAREVFEKIDRQTLGQLISNFRNKIPVSSEFEATLALALDDRNRLNHSFYRAHNFRRNSEEGRALMLEDLEAMRERILGAYLDLLRLEGVEIESLKGVPLTTEHLPLDVKQKP